MSARLSVLVLLSTLVAREGHAAPASGWDQPPPRAVPPHIPDAARGFQAALRSGVSLPWGKATEEAADDFSARYGLSIPVVIDAGFKLSKPVFLGIYLGFARGGVGESARVDALCETDGVSCDVVSYQVGVQGQYHFAASDIINPWIGYGVGYEVIEQTIDSESYSEKQSSSGVTYAKLGLGVDLRSMVGIGPFVEVSAGRFDASSTTVDETQVHEGPVDAGAWHGFLTFGVRLVALP